MLSAKLQAEHPYLRAYTATEVGGLMQADITVSHAGSSTCSNFTREGIGSCDLPVCVPDGGVLNRRDECDGLTSLTVS